MTSKDDWDRPRGRQNHLTEDEIAYVQKAFREGAKPHVVARHLKCATRTIQTRFAWLGSGHRRTRERSEPTRRFEPTRRTPQAPSKASVSRPSRFYKSDFVPS